MLTKQIAKNINILLNILSNNEIFAKISVKLHLQKTENHKSTLFKQLNWQSIARILSKQQQTLNNTVLVLKYTCTTQYLNYTVL